MSFTASLEQIVAANHSGLLGKAAHWERVRLGSVAQILNGFPFPSAQFARESGVPLLRIRDLQKTSTAVYFDGVVDPQFIVEPNELVVGMDGDFHASLWRGPKAALNQRVCKITPDQRVLDRQFLAYVLPGYLAAVNAETSAITVKHLSSKTIADLPIPLPALPEQRRIVAVIDEYLSELEAAVLGLQRAGDRLARYKAAVVARAVTGGAMATGDIANEFELPLGWRWRSLSECCTKIDNGNTPPPDKMFSGSGDIPFIKVYNLTFDGRLDFSVKPTFIGRATHEGPLRRSRLLPGDILTNIVGPPLGKVAVVPDTFPEWNTNQAVVCFRTGPVLVNRYLALLLQADPIIRRLSSQARATAGQFNISLTMCRTLRIPVPPSEQQEQILVDIEHRLSIANRSSAEVDVQLARARRLRQSILKSAFEGTLVPQEASDRTAHGLLGRIRSSVSSGALTTGPSKRSSRSPTRRSAN